MDEESTEFSGTWAIVELLGRIRMAGFVTEAKLFGGAVGRINIPIGEATMTQYFGGGSLFRLTPVTEEMARSVAKHNEPRPIHVYEIPQLADPQQSLFDRDDEAEDYDF